MYTPTLHEAMMAYYRGELGGFELEYLRMLYEIVLRKHSDYEQQVILREITDREFLADVALYGRIRDEIGRIIRLKDLTTPPPAPSRSGGPSCEGGGCRSGKAPPFPPVGRGGVLKWNLFFHYKHERQW